MADNEKDKPDVYLSDIYSPDFYPPDIVPPNIYAILGLSAPPETTIIPAKNQDIFAIKKENVDRLDSLIRVVLGAGVFLCDAYRLDKKTARDERGEIWKASDIQASRNVTIFLPPLEVRKDESACEPVRQAAKRLEALDHPRIVPVLENFTDPEHGFFTVRKFVNGNTLDTYRKEYVKRHGKFAPIRATKIIKDIAHALDYAHSVDIFHGDLCPKNIIVGLDDEIYIDNFVLVSVQANTPSATRRPYQSPEVAEGKPATAHSDVYALAAIAYELLSGRSPYSPETMDTPLPIPHVPSTVDAVIRKAMAILPDDRYDSCGTFSEELEASFRKPSKVKPVVPTPSKKPSVKRALLATLYYMGLLIAFLGIFSVALGCFIYFEGVKSTVLNAVQKWIEPPPEPVEPPPEPVEPPPEPVEPPPEPVEPPPEPVEPLPEPIEPPPPKPVEPLPKTIKPPPEPVEPLPKTVKPQPEPIEPPPEPVEPPPEANNSAPRTTVLALFNAGLHEEGEIKTIAVNGIKQDFRWCSPGYFMEGFWILETAVTRETWQTVMGPVNTRDQFAEGARLPMRRVSWNECQKFLDVLNQMGILARDGLEGCRFALPTEKQWVYACDKKMFVPYEIWSEWCDEWQDERNRYRVVRGGGNFRGNRDPEEPLGYTEVCFRIVIVPNE